MDVLSTDYTRDGRARGRLNEMLECWILSEIRKQMTNLPKQERRQELAEIKREIEAMGRMRTVKLSVGGSIGGFKAIETNKTRRERLRNEK